MPTNINRPKQASAFTLGCWHCEAYTVHSDAPARAAAAAAAADQYASLGNALPGRLNTANLTSPRFHILIMLLNCHLNQTEFALSSTLNSQMTL